MESFSHATTCDMTHSEVDCAPSNDLLLSLGVTNCESNPVGNMSIVAVHEPVEIKSAMLQSTLTE